MKRKTDKQNRQTDKQADYINIVIIDTINFAILLLHVKKIFSIKLKVYNL